MAGEICEKCGREIPSYQQACVFKGEIVCAECDRVLRNEQVSQPTPSPEPSPETRKGTKKDVSLRNRILAAIGIIIIAVVLWKVCFSGPKYQVEHWFEKNNSGLFQKGKEWFLKVRIEGPAAELVVMITEQKGEAVCQERIDREEMMDNVQTATFGITDYGIEDENSRIIIYVLPLDFGSHNSGRLKPGDYSLVVKNFVLEKVIYKVSIKLPPEKVIKVGGKELPQSDTDATDGPGY